MGLDMYATARTTAEPEYDTAGFESRGEKIAYWRKFNALHGWMEDRYAEKNGHTPEQIDAAWPYFNGEELELTLELLDRLEKETNQLTPRQGFFFGAQEVHPDDLATLPKFLADAREAIGKGLRVFYHASY